MLGLQEFSRHRESCLSPHVRARRHMRRGYCYMYTIGCFLATECRTTQLWELPRSHARTVPFLPAPPSETSTLSLSRHYYDLGAIHPSIAAIMAKDSTAVLDKPVDQPTGSSGSSKHSSSSTNTTPPTVRAARMIGDLKIVHESPGEGPTQRERRSDLPISREELLEQATKFLESSPIKNAPLKEKLEFLHSKGLTKVETEALLAKLEEKVTKAIPASEEKGKGKKVYLDRSLR